MDRDQETSDEDEVTMNESAGVRRKRGTITASDPPPFARRRIGGARVFHTESSDGGDGGEHKKDDVNGDDRSTGNTASAQKGAVEDQLNESPQTPQAGGSHSENC